MKNGLMEFTIEDSKGKIWTIRAETRKEVEEILLDGCKIKEIRI